MTSGHVMSSSAAEQHSRRNGGRNCQKVDGMLLTADVEENTTSRTIFNESCRQHDDVVSVFADELPLRINDGYDFEMKTEIIVFFLMRLCRENG